ncbi:hypothetical protein NQ314_020569 [Rhamnusium bicolor]|uniref:MADF domain-containing protein n=1 Tax=Rhamnusium bicolor TaxID=1586634 RepID=A0AAV8WL93_9CUCU|nr:hypothetical protein NQ314_020569 [Rhamnusium bicolor]
MEWTKELLTEFIDLYREKSCLWKIKDSSYVNKNMKREAYDDLVNFLKNKNFTVTVAEVKKKIQNLRNAFRKDKKIEDSLRSGSGTEDV